jgi:hypothetical protein
VSVWLLGLLLVTGAPDATDAGDAGAAAALGKVTFEPPLDVSDLRVTFDDRPVLDDLLTHTYSVPPGPHHVHAEGLLDRQWVQFDGDVTVEGGRTLTVRMPMAVRTNDFVGELPRCFTEARDQAEVDQCINWGLCQTWAFEPETECSGYGFDDQGHRIASARASTPPKVRSCGACAVAAREEPAPFALLLAVPIIALARRAGTRRLRSR